MDRVEGLTQLKSVVEYWKLFDIDNKRLILDKQCIELREGKNASIVGRRRLNEVTKQFRAKSKEEQLLGIAELLKAYQDEIDQLSRRAKGSEAAFFSLYKSIYDAPDPVPPCEQLLHHLEDTGSQSKEVERLRAELEHYDEEFRALKNQDITIRRLEEELAALQESMEERVEEEILKRATAIEEAADARVEECKEHQRAAERRLVVALESVNQAQAAADRAQGQLLDMSSEYEKRLSAQLMDNTMANEAVDRLRTRVAELEGELAALRNNSAVSRRSAEKDEDAQDESTEERLQVLSDLNHGMRQELLRKDEALSHERNKHEQQMRDMTRQLRAEQAEVSRLRQELSLLPSPEDISALKHQLKVLHKVLFNVTDDASEDASVTGEPELTQHREQQQLETMLIGRIRTLESELADARVTIDELKQKETNSSTRVQSLQTSLDASKALVARLEADLQLQTSGRSVGPPNNATTQQQRQAAAELEELLLQPNAITEAKTSGQESMVSILQAQRDRYKERLDKAEESLGNMHAKCSVLEAKIAKLSSDNVEMYSKIRYLQNNVSGQHRGDIEAGGSDWESQYGSSLEQSFNPFASVRSDISLKFNIWKLMQMEKSRRLRALTGPEKMLLNGATLCMSNRNGRTILDGGLLSPSWLFDESWHIIKGIHREHVVNVLHASYIVYLDP